MNKMVKAAKAKKKVAANSSTKAKTKSKQDESKSIAPVAFRLNDEELTKMDELRVLLMPKLGSLPNRTQVIKHLISEAHQKLNK